MLSDIKLKGIMFKSCIICCEHFHLRYSPQDIPLKYRAIMTATLIQYCNIATFIKQALSSKCRAYFQHLLYMSLF